MSGGREWDSMKTKGAAKLLHSLYMLVTFPLRHPVFSGAFVCAAFVVFYFRIELLNMTEQYFGEIPVRKAVKLQKDMSAKISQKISGIKDTVKEILPDGIFPETTEKKEEKKDVFVGWNAVKFRQAEYKPSYKAEKKSGVLENIFLQARQRILNENENQNAEEESSAAVSGFPVRHENQAEKKNAKEVPDEVYFEGKLTDFYVVKKNLPLEYLQNPEKLYGTAEILSANSLLLDGEFLYLYGIYTNPAVYDVTAAMQYLESVAGGRKIHCDVVAYARPSDVATALCFVDGILINKAMADSNFAENVALR